MSQDLLDLVRRGIRKRPRVVARRLWDELNAEVARFTTPGRQRRFDTRALLRATNAGSVPELWERLADRSFPACTCRQDGRRYEDLCPGDGQRIVAQAAAACARRIDLLGSGPVQLGTPIDWHRDYKTNLTWPVEYMRDIDYCNPDRPSDVKVPWEISRAQWLIPVGQAYLLTGDEQYATFVRTILDEWIADNPYARGVNWACTLEPAMRILSWTWFFHVFRNSAAWRDGPFRERLLRALYLHGEFVHQHIERSDLNGNHFTADAAALVFAGLFFGQGAAPQQWAETGWTALVEELPRQVFDDGVDFEGSIAYHRFVLELFFLPARYREVCHLPVDVAYREHLVAMARFGATYSRPDGTVPLVGDADNARALPFDCQGINDHRYLAGVVGACWDVSDLRTGFAGSRAEVVWLLGPNAAATLPAVNRPAGPPRSTAFRHSGFFVMRNEVDHVFIDCGPVGQSGRGGHGHNDCLSFEAVLDGTPLVTDCGAYVYTASYSERNAFRSTAYHNTPQIDDEEINRFVRPDYLWTLHNDARPDVRRWETGPARDVFCGAHAGYQRLPLPVTPVRTIVLDHANHTLSVSDTFEGGGPHRISIPLHLAAGVGASVLGPGRIRLRAGEQEFVLRWSSEREWTVEIVPGRLSPSYGLIQQALRIIWHRTGDAAALTVEIAPTLVAERRPQHQALASIGG